MQPMRAMRAMLVLILFLHLMLVGNTAQANIFGSQLGGQWLQSHRPAVILQKLDADLEDDELSEEPAEENASNEPRDEDLRVPDAALTE